MEKTLIFYANSCKNKSFLRQNELNLNYLKNSVNNCLLLEYLQITIGKLQGALKGKTMSQSNFTSAISFGARVRKSPFFNSTIDDGAKSFTIYNHMYMPTAYAGTFEEYRSLTNDVTMWDVSCERQIEINGPDAHEFLRLITPRNLDKCEIGHCLYILLTDQFGGIVNDAVLLRLEENKFWVSPGDGDALLWIQGVSIWSGLNVEVFEPDVSPLQIGGPKSPQLIDKLFAGAHNDLRFFKARETSLDGIPLVIARTGWSGEISYELYLRNSDMGNALWQKVKAAGQEFNIAPVAPNLVRSIEGGMLSYVSDIRREDCPFTIGLDRLVDTEQPANFIGKDALKRIRQEGPKNKLVGIEIDGDQLHSAPENPWPIKIGGKFIGHVSRAIYSPRLNKNIGFAHVESDYSTIGLEIIVESPKGNMQAKISTFPWIKAERIQRH